jgi:DNA-binding CsgD family transcriptional regulator
VIIEHLKNGKSQRQIAKLMGLHHNTVGTYLDNARNRRGAASLEQLMFWIGQGKV